MGPQSAAKRITHTNFEFKARLKDDLRVRAALKKLRARFVGTDHQIDTYFRVASGRLKLREGRIENALIFYHRTNRQHARESKVQIAELPSGSGVRGLLEAALGVLAVVEKRREIYFVGNVKIHLDRVPGLGEFVEVEAIKKSKPAGGEPKIRRSTIRRQARDFQRLFGVTDSEIVPLSYSDLVPKKPTRRAKD
jgi:adenylate cyclase, class 2